jgi:hypothetical protein
VFASILDDYLVGMSSPGPDETITTNSESTSSENRFGSMHSYLVRRRKQMESQLAANDKEGAKLLTSDADQPILSMRTRMDLIVIFAALIVLAITLHVEYQVDVVGIVHNQFKRLLDPDLPPPSHASPR